MPQFQFHCTECSFVPCVKKNIWGRGCGESNRGESGHQSGCARPVRLPLFGAPIGARDSDVSACGREKMLTMRWIEDNSLDVATIACRGVNCEVWMSVARRNSCNNSQIPEQSLHHAFCRTSRAILTIGVIVCSPRHHARENFERFTARMVLLVEGWGQFNWSRSCPCVGAPFALGVAVLELVTTQHQPCVTLQTTPRTPKIDGTQREPSSPGRDPEQLHDVNLPILDAKHLTHHLPEFLGLTAGWKRWFRNSFSLAAVEQNC